MTSTNQRTGQPASPRAPLPSGFAKEPGSSNRGFASMDPERQRDASRQAGKTPQTSGSSSTADQASGGAPKKGTTGR